MIWSNLSKHWCGRKCNSTISCLFIYTISFISNWVISDSWYFNILIGISLIECKTIIFLIRKGLNWMLQGLVNINCGKIHQFVYKDLLAARGCNCHCNLICLSALLYTIDPLGALGLMQNTKTKICLIYFIHLVAPSSQNSMIKCNVRTCKNMQWP